METEDGPKGEIEEPSFASHVIAGTNSLRPHSSVETEKEKMKNELQELCHAITEKVETMEEITYVRNFMKPLLLNLDSIKPESSPFEVIIFKHE